MSEDAERCRSCGLPLAQCQENRQIVMDFLDSAPFAGDAPTFAEMMETAETFEETDCFSCGLPLTAEVGAVELVYDDGETEWICFPCAASLPPEPLEHIHYAAEQDAERVEARDLQMLSQADRSRPVEDVPNNERL